MTLHDYLALLRRSWLLITVTTVLGIGLGVAASLLSTPVYSASAQLFVSVQSAEGDGVGTAYTGGLFVQQRIVSYTEVVGSPGVLEPVIDELDLATTPPALAGQVTATSPTGTVLIDVQATDTDPQLAADIANAAARSLGEQIQELETTTAGTAPVKVSITTPAGVPTGPVSPNNRLNLLLGAFLGLGVGVSIALLRHTLDTTVKSGAELARTTESTVLGAITYDPQAKSNPLVALDPTSVRSEALRSIRTNLQYIDVDNPARSVVVTSSVPDEGKTTTACNLAITLGQAGSRVLLIEADLRRPRVADYLGIAGGVGLTDVLIGRASFDDVVVPWRRGLLDVLPSGPIPPNPSELLGSQQMGQVLADLATRYDVILLDAPPLLPVTDAAVLANLADGAILIVRYGVTKREQVEHAAETLRQVSGRLLGVVMNFVPAKSGRGYGYGYGYEYSATDGEGSKEGGQGSPRGRLDPDKASNGVTPGAGKAPGAGSATATKGSSAPVA